MAEPLRNYQTRTVPGARVDADIDQGLRAYMIKVYNLMGLGLLITGLAAVLHTSAVAFETLKYLGVAYLLYMAWNTLKEKGGLSVDQNVAPRSAGKVITSGILINILNPKLSIFFFAFLPQFVSTTEPHALSKMLELSGVFMLMTFLVFVAYGAFAASIRNHVVSRPAVLTWMRRTFAGAFVMLGAKLALADR